MIAYRTPFYSKTAFVMHRSVMLFLSIMKSSMGFHHREGKPLVLLGLILAALCFSAGEGLRLTPFPAGNVTGITLQEGLLGNHSSCETSTPKYGPIDLPKRTSAQSKHRVFDVDCLAAQIVIKRTSSFCKLPVAGDTSKIASLHLISRARDRAPPLSPS